MESDRSMNLPPRGDAQTWKPLRYFNLYRLTLSGLFVTLFFSGPTPELLGQHDRRLFAIAGVAYLALVLISGFAHRLRWPSFGKQVRANMLVDIACITALMHASGGVTTGLGMLLLVTIASGSMLMSERGILVIAAIASLAVLGEQTYSHLANVFPQTAYTQAGILGATYFATALLVHVLAHRIRASEALAAQRGVDLANLQQLNEYIIQHMQSGIVVVDRDDRIRLMNASARYLLGVPERGWQRPLPQVSPELLRQLRNWHAQGDFETHAFRTERGNAEVIPRFARLGEDANAGTVIFLEDAAVATRQAQQMKLASLGRLTASIAHEIRNPLGAISHAGQLLSESPALEQADTRLTQIIRDQSQRVNTIIENVLQLSRRERWRPEVLNLNDWVETFLKEFTESNGCARNQVAAEIQPQQVQVLMDPSHLHQVVWNLCQNAVRYGTLNGNAKVQLRGGITLESRGPFLDVIDHGPGIRPEDASQIFEPFFTTDPAGTGLGLYIARELCEFNQAQLGYVPIPSGGSCFRITFADPRRQVL